MLFVICDWQFSRLIRQIQVKVSVLKKRLPSIQEFKGRGTIVKSHAIGKNLKFCPIRCRKYASKSQSRYRLNSIRDASSCYLHIQLLSQIEKEQRLLHHPM